MSLNHNRIRRIRTSGTGIADDFGKCLKQIFGHCLHCNQAWVIRGGILTANGERAYFGSRKGVHRSMPPRNGGVYGPASD